MFDVYEMPSISITIGKNEQRIRKVANQSVNDRPLHSEGHFLGIKATQNDFEVVVFSTASENDRLSSQGFRGRFAPIFARNRLIDPLIIELVPKQLLELIEIVQVFQDIEYGLLIRS